MKTDNQPVRNTAWALLLAGATLLPTLAGAAAATTAQQRYEQERAACTSGQSNQDRATCLREAGAALAEARRGGAATDETAYQKNQLLRCEPLPAADREACVARMSGQGTSTGSAASGGIYRELVTREPAAVVKP